jgi:hypothetical protein
MKEKHGTMKGNRVAVKIIQSNTSVWYENLLGRSFVVEDYSIDYYQVVGGIHGIKKSHCEICKEVAYIAHPIAGDVYGNIQEILKIVNEIYVNEPGVTPFTPYLAGIMTGTEDTPETRERGLKEDEFYISSGIVTSVRLYGTKISSGMEREINRAHELGVQVFAKTRETKLEFKRIYIDNLINPE